MNRQAQFENSLRTFAAATYVNEAKQRAAQAIREALKCLEEDPTIASGDPESIFTYEHPVLASAAKAYLVDAPTAPFARPGDALRPSNWFDWLAVGVNGILNHAIYDKDLVDLAGKVPLAPINVEREPLRLAIVGDAGFRGWPQERVCQLIRAEHAKVPFNYIIHLGDIYFAGSYGEILKNFLEEFKTVGAPILTLCGNHDLYFGAGPFKALLSVLDYQPGRYFAIESPNWRILCLDTSSGSTSLLRDDGRLDDDQLQWVERLVRRDDGRNVVLMSHHFIRSAWGKVSPTLRHQLAALAKDRVFSWYWGHEHSCVTYSANGWGFFGACVGNGAFLEPWRLPSDTADAPEWYATGRCNCLRPSGTKFWEHGFLELELAGPILNERFHLESGVQHLRMLKG